MLKYYNILLFTVSWFVNYLHFRALIECHIDADHKNDASHIATAAASFIKQNVPSLYKQVFGMMVNTCSLITFTHVKVYEGYYKFDYMYVCGRFDRIILFSMVINHWILFFLSLSDNILSSKKEIMFSNKQCHLNVVIHQNDDEIFVCKIYIYFCSLKMWHILINIL